MPTSPDVAAVFATPQTGPTCWYKRPQPAAVRAYIEAVEAHMTATGGAPVFSLLGDKLREMGADLSDDKLRRHYKRRCSCWR